MKANLEWYRVFLEVAKNESFSATGKKLFISQSAVSQTIASLENKLGGDLFYRGKKGVSLTEEGKAIWEDIDKAFRFIEHAEQVFEEMKKLKSGTIRIGASDTVCNIFLLDKLDLFNEKYPDIKIKVTNRTTDESLALLREGEVDMAFVNLPIAPDEDFAMKEIIRIHDCFVVGKKHLHLAEKERTLKDLVHYPILMLEKTSNSRRQMEIFFALNGVQVNPAIELGSLDVLADFAKIGLGVAAVIEEAVQEEIKKGELFKINLNEKPAPRSIGMVTMKGFQNSFAGKAFQEML